jgi:hypothetical protein
MYFLNKATKDPSFLSLNILANKNDIFMAQNLEIKDLQKLRIICYNYETYLNYYQIRVLVLGGQKNSKKCS